MPFDQLIKIDHVDFHPWSRYRPINGNISTRHDALHAIFKQFFYISNNY